MTKIIAFICCSYSYFLTSYAFAQQSEPSAIEQAPQVGKHVMANMNASSMILSLLMVLGVIIISAIVLKRFNLTQQNSSQLKVIASLSLGAKERIVVVQIGDEQLVLGVSSQQINLLKNLETPIDVQVGKPLALSTNVLSFLQQNRNSKNETDTQTTSNTTNNK
ncbi:flagellar biosynthetic protein FliO [Colwellia sp. MSW7]|jgi:flagellar protein FliO/FliZ|uniref:Flagellar protein n=1 Tax=Colwellia maritima TaxID=2912588 RepID=A0ABS9X336_9GAMM|nr:flagellar biosynthetic protein FliO [Colwellia maritima]MCI2284604.1 flagellar biosynthetic protein FliO [Colwellia maritima]